MILSKNRFGQLNPKIKVLDKGEATLLDVMPRLVEDGQTCDSAIAQMARTSYQKGTKTLNDDKTLIRHLMRHRHTSPFEGVEFKFFIKLPIFTQGQFIRHRTFSVNQESARYSVIHDDFYIPEKLRKQSVTNKQGSSNEELDENQKYVDLIHSHCKETYEKYEMLLNKGASREQARMILPQNIYTSCIYKMDAHNLLHFLALRCDGHAQQEIREYANAVLKLVTPLIPWTIEAWNEYHPMRDAMIFTQKECEKLADIMSYFKTDEQAATTYDINLNSGNKREDAEWIEKMKKMLEIYHKNIE